MNEKNTIALLTDFGLADAYVGIMKGVMASILPSASFIDISHSVPPQSVRQAAYILLTSYRFFPPDTVFLVVVDPGVGTSRAPVAVATSHGAFVAPDNGVLSYVLAENPATYVTTLENPEYLLPEPSRTFHGRDIFSPAAAHLARGVPIHALGNPHPALIQLPTPQLSIEDAAITGEVLHIDHFGNIITSVGICHWANEHLVVHPRFTSGQDQARVTTTMDAAACRVRINEKDIGPIRATYGAVSVGELVALVGSSGHLEIGMNQGHAANALGVRLGDTVTVRYA